MLGIENELVFRRAIDECFNNGDLSVADELVSEDFIEHQDFYGALPRGPEAFKAAVLMLRAMVPDLQLTIDELVATDDTVWARITGRGTNAAPFLGHPPSGKPIQIDAVDIVRIRDGRICEHWGVADLFGIVIQLGLVQTLAPTPA